MTPATGNFTTSLRLKNIYESLNYKVYMRNVIK